MLGFMIFLSMFQHVHPQSKIDSLHAILYSDLDDSTAYEISINLAMEFENNKPDSALYFYKQALEISEENQWNALKAKALINMGFAHYYNNKKDTAISFFRKGLEIYIKSNDKVNAMNIYYNLGYFYNDLEDYNSAIEAFNNAIELAEELDNKNRLADAYNSLGLVYYYIGHYEKAITNHIKSLKIKESLGDHAEHAHLNLALDYLGQGNFKKALEHNFKALKAVEKPEDQSAKAIAIKNIGDIYSDLNQLDSARLYYDSAYQIYRGLNDKVSISRYFMVLGVLHQKKHEYNESLAR
jgi:tetratricopeptide (TPR) repeat protein